MDKEEFIAITHFINPQLFWYHKVDSQTPEFVESKRIEDSIQLLYTAKQSAAFRPHRPNVGEIVGIAFVSWNKFIRARVMHIIKFTKAPDEYIVWALDYGFPFQTKVSYIRQMPESYHRQTGHICIGGIAGVIPAELDFDLVTTTSQIVAKPSWSQRCVEMLEKLLNDAASISFIESFQVEHPEKQHFGDMKVITHSGSSFFVSDYLVKLNHAIECEDNFRNKLLTLKTNHIPCWETNSRDVKIIENKLSSLNIEMGKFDLSGSLSDSCDLFSKQKVMDWCERNENINDKNESTELSFPKANFDATDIEFDDSVSVKNLVAPTGDDEDEESIMKSAGKVHETRRRMYKDKMLPPKPDLGTFDMSMEEKKSAVDEKSQSNSVLSGKSARIKMLLELRKAHSKTVAAKENEMALKKQFDQIELNDKSETGTAEFLENCKIKNAKILQSKPLTTTTESSSTTNSDHGSYSSTSISKRKQKLMKIKEAYCAKKSENILDKSNAITDMNTLDDKTESRSTTGSRVSSYAQSLINKRNKILQQRSSKQAASGFIVEQQKEEIKSKEPRGYKMPLQSEKFSRLDFSRGSRDYNIDTDTNTINTVPQASAADDDSNPQNNTQISTEELRRIINEDPYKNMTMVPAGFNVTKLVKRRDEVNHWHTKKTTLNENIHSNYELPEYQPMNTNDISRRTEDIDDFFRLTRSSKERKKPIEDNLLNSNFDEGFASPNLKEESNCAARNKENIFDSSFDENANKSQKQQANSNQDQKHLLDLSLNDSNCAKAITPELVTDLLTFNDTIEEKKDDVSKLIDLSSTRSEDIPDKFPSENQMFNGSKSNGNKDFLEEFNFFSKLGDDEGLDKTASSDSFLKQMNALNAIKGTSREKLLETSNTTTSDESFDLIPKTSKSNKIEKFLANKSKKNTTEPDGYSSSISSTSFEKVQISKEPKEDTLQVGKVRDAYHSYEASESSGSSSSKNKIKSTEKLNQKLKAVESSANSDSNENMPSPNSSLLSPQPSLTSNNKKKKQTQHSTKHSPKVLNQKEYLSSLADSYVQTYQATISSNLPEVTGEASLKTNFVQHLVLAHSKNNVKPIESMKNALFSPEIHQEMEHMRLTKMYRIQAYAWSHLVRGNCFCVINTNRTGKTWCYLPPVCSMLSFRLDSTDIPKTYGPVVIIIAPSSVQVESIARHCRRILASTTPRISIVPAYGFRNKDEVKIELHNGCGVLVITPPCLQRLLEANEKENLLNIRRIQTLVIDGLDSILAENPEFDETLRKLVSPVLEDDKLPFQLVVTSKTWSRRLINLLRIGNQPLLCIADYLEAAVYAKAKVSIKLQSRSEKLAVVMKCLDKCAYQLERCVILCNSGDEVLEVETCLRECGYMCMVYTDQMSADTSDMINEWKEKTVCHQILITSDSVLPELMIKNVWTLIHYSLPMSWTKFNFRFSLFLDNYENLLISDFEKPSKVPKSLILLDENNNLQLPRLIEFMMNHNQLKNIHPDILKVAAKVTADREELRTQQGVSMCPKILEFGSCDGGNRCSYRHQLTKYDGPAQGIPRNREIRIKILEVISPTHYIARILTHKQQGVWEEVRRSNEFATFSMKMSMHFMNDEARVIHWPPKVSDVCVYRDGNNYHRCRILEVLSPIVYESIVKSLNVKIKLIDSGKSIMCKSLDLLIVPEEFKDFPPQAIDIHLSGVIPFDKERVWDSKSIGSVKKWILTDVCSNDVLQANIDFVLMDIIWVNNVVLMEKLDAINGFALKINVRRSLIGRGFALADEKVHSVKQTAMENNLLKPEPGVKIVQKPEEEENLLEFSTSSEEKNVSNCDEILPSVSPNTSVSQSKEKSVLDKTVQNKKKVSPKLQEEWSSMQMDELSQVKIAELTNLSKFFMRLLNKEDDVRDLEELIRNLPKEPLQDPHPSQNCLAPHENSYYRAKIQRILVDSDDGCVTARVFFCDTGLLRNIPLDNLRSSNNSIIEFMPFQAICCKLTGINEECDIEDIEKIIQLDDSVHLAYAVKELTAGKDEFGGHYYEIILYECFTDKKDIQINKLLVENGLATYNDETKHFLELETEVDFDNFDYQEGDPYDFQSFLERVKQQMDEEDEDDEDELRNSSKIEMIKENGEEPKIVEITEDFKEIQEEPKIVDISDVQEDSNVSKEELNSSPPPLKALHKRPITTWHETMCMIYLEIHSPDIDDYHLEVHPQTIIFVATVRGEVNVLTLNLLGYIRPELVTHEIRGLNVIVRLVKDLFVPWPRLLKDPTKFAWLKYNFNAIGLLQDEEMFGKLTQIKKSRLRCSSESSGYSQHSNPCETFTPIVNNDQMYDPMQDLF